MSNWRIEIKEEFEKWIVEAVPEIKFFKDWNNDKLKSETETHAEIGIAFEYSSVGYDSSYLLQNNVDYAAKVPVVVTIHILFSTFNDESQNCAYDYANKVVCSVAGRKTEHMNDNIKKMSEIEDTDHRGLYDYQITFGFTINEAISRGGLDTTNIDFEVTGIIERGLGV